MDNGLIMALFASLAFAGSIVAVRRTAGRVGESFTAAEFSIFVGIPFFAVAVSITGEWGKLLELSWPVFTLLGIAGILHFVVGRLLSYSSYRIIGANKAAPLTNANQFYTVIFGILFLNEALTVFLVLGVLCIFTGTTLITVEKKSVSDETPGGFFSTEVKGIIAALGGALCWGTTPILIKTALAEIGSPYVGAFVSYVVAFIAIMFFFLRRRHREQLGGLRFPFDFLSLMVVGILAATGQLFHFTALNFSPASLVVPIVATNTLFVFILSFFINRNIEVFSLKVVMGTLMVVAGTFLLFQ